MIRRPPRSTLSSSSAASDVYKRQLLMWFFSFRDLNHKSIKFFDWFITHQVPIIICMIFLSLDIPASSSNSAKAELTTSAIKDDFDIPRYLAAYSARRLSLIHISEPTRLG